LLLLSNYITYGRHLGLIYQYHLTFHSFSSEYCISYIAVLHVAYIYHLPQQQLQVARLSSGPIVGDSSALQTRHVVVCCSSPVGRMDTKAWTSVLAGSVVWLLVPITDCIAWRHKFYVHSTVNSASASKSKSTKGKFI